MNNARPLARCAYLIVLPAACVLMTACSGGSSSTPPAAKASSTPTATAAATPAATAAATAAPTTGAGSGPATPHPSAPACYDACNHNEPVLLFIPTHSAANNYGYTVVRPTTIDLSVDTPGSNVAEDLTWSSWPSGPNGVVPASATATATGTIKTTGQAVTITLSDPQNGDPSIWQVLTEQVQGQHAGVYHYNGLWAGSASGGQTIQ